MSDFESSEENSSYVDTQSTSSVCEGTSEDSEIIHSESENSSIDEGLEPRRAARVARPG